MTNTSGCYGHRMICGIDCCKHWAVNGHATWALI